MLGPFCAVRRTIGAPHFGQIIWGVVGGVASGGRVGMGAPVSALVDGDVGAEDAGEGLRCTLWINSASWRPSIKSIDFPAAKDLASCVNIPDVTTIAPWAFLSVIPPYSSRTTFTPTLQTFHFPAVPLERRDGASS